MNLTVDQRETIQSFERAGASLSLVGVFLIFITYATFKRLRTVPNTFMLFASIANVGASTACLIGYSGVLAGDPSALCQVQGFLLEMSVPVSFNALRLLAVSQSYSYGDEATNIKSIVYTGDSILG